jgi:predicted DNA-binding transcriptional regulator AlpA
VQKNKLKSVSAHDPDTGSLVANGVLDPHPAARVDVSPRRTRASRGLPPTGKLLDPSEERILTTDELLRIIPLTRVTLWRMSREGRFVKPIQLTSSRIGWRWSAVLAWLSERERHPVESRVYFGKDRDEESVPTDKV